MDKNSEYKKWIEFAEQDYQAAIFLKDKTPLLMEITAFHCQQCAEKYIKAFLIYANREIKKTHNLEELCKISSAFDKDFEKIKDQCIDLTDFAVEIRYPYPFQLEPDDVKKAIADMETIRTFITLKLPE